MSVTVLHQNGVLIALFRLHLVIRSDFSFFLVYYGILSIGYGYGVSVSG